MIKHLLTFSLAILLFSCSEPCDDVDCGANGACDEVTGSCICDDWYEGTNCETETRGKFLSTWESITGCSINGDSDPTWIISAGTSPNSIFLKSVDFYSNRIIEGTLTDENNVTITPFSTGTEFTGEMKYIDASTLVLTFSLETQSNGTFDCPYTLTK